MPLLLDVLMFIGRVVLVIYCVRHSMFIVTGTTRTYAEWSKGVGAFLYLLGIVFILLQWEHIIPGRDVARVMQICGLALLVLPAVLRWLAPSAYVRLTTLEDC